MLNKKPTHCREYVRSELSIFLIITIVGYRWLTSPGSMSYPLDKHRRIWLDGPERFWILTFSTGLLALSAPAGLDLTAVRLFMLELFCLLGLLFVCKRRVQWTAATVVYVIYLFWLVIGLTYSPAPGYGFRVILKYIYPLLIMQFASAAVRDVEVFLKASFGARMIALISIVFAFVPFIGVLASGVFWYGTAAAINYISIMIFHWHYFIIPMKNVRIYSTRFYLYSLALFGCSGPPLWGRWLQLWHSSSLSTNFAPSQL